jgi:hypothetical protein
MAGGAEQAGSLLNIVAPQYFNRPARNFKERVVDLAPDDLFPSTKRTLQLDDDGEDDGEDDGAGRADDGEGGEPSRARFPTRILEHTGLPLGQALASLTGLSRTISIGSKNPELYYSTLYGKEIPRSAVNHRSSSAVNYGRRTIFFPSELLLSLV